MSESACASWLLIKSKWITFIVKCLKHILKGREFYLHKTLIKSLSPNTVLLMEFKVWCIEIHTIKHKMRQYMWNEIYKGHVDNNSKAYEG